MVRCVSIRNVAAQVVLRGLVFPPIPLRPSETCVEGHFFEIPVIQIGSCT